MEVLNAINCLTHLRSAVISFVILTLIYHPTIGFSPHNNNKEIQNQLAYTTNLYRSNLSIIKNENITAVDIVEKTLNDSTAHTERIEAKVIQDEGIEISSEKLSQLQQISTTDELFDHSTNKKNDEFSPGKDSTEHYITTSWSVSATEDYTTQKTSKDIVQHFTVPNYSFGSDKNHSAETSVKQSEADALTQQPNQVTNLTNNWTTEPATYDGSSTDENAASVKIRNSEITTTDKSLDEKTSKVFDLTDQDETTLFQFWTTLSNDMPNPKTESNMKLEKETVTPKPLNKVSFVKDNKQTTGHLITVATVNKIVNKDEVNKNIYKTNIKYKIPINIDDNEDANFTTDSVDNLDVLSSNNSATIEEINVAELSLDKPSPDNDLAKNGDDLEIDLTESQSTQIERFDHSSNISYVDRGNLTVSDQDKEILEASDYGMKMMNDLYGVQEPKLYNMGMWLEADNPARFVATFNGQSEEARKLARFGYAALQASMHLKQKFPEELESRISADQDDDDLANEIKKRPSKPTLVRGSALRQQCPLRGDPRCPAASKRYRTHDGTCNNARRPRWGSALSPVQRFLPPEYGDGIQSVRSSRSGRRLPSARAVSDAVHSARTPSELADAPVTHMLMQWGQFLDHDITSSSQARGFNGSVPRCCGEGGREFIPREFLHPECMPIPVHEDDPFYGPRGIRCLDFVRSSPAPRAGCELGYREQLNQVTAFIDGSPIYSSSAKQSDKLRLFRNGLLQYGRQQAQRPLLPSEETDEEALCRGGAVDSSCFKAGDGRVNEHPGLVAMHIVWLRKHNRLTTELSHLNPHWSDEKVYQETRKIIGAFIQHVTYREFLPIILGSEVMRLFELELMKKGYYKGYSSKVNPNPANSFGAAAFRFGHSLVQDSFMRYDRFHRPIHNNVSLHEELTNPSNIWSFGAVDRLLLGLSNQPAQRRDEFISSELTNHLFQTSRFNFGMDLASINIQRGRDHGIPPYVQWREPCGLTPVLQWEDLLKIMPLRAVRRMEDVYRDVEDVDLFTGGMAERPVIGGLVGPTFACIIAQQFSNLRKGDRFWYENGGFESSFTPAQLQQIRKISLAQVLCQTMENVETLQPFVFLAPDDFRNERISCTNHLLNNFDLTPWTERHFDQDNNINSLDRTLKPKPTTGHPSTFNDLLPDTFSNSKTNVTTKRTEIPQTEKLDDKLDIPKNPKPTPTTTTMPSTRPKMTTKSSFIRPTVQTKHTTKDVIKLDDKLDFSKKITNVQKSKINDLLARTRDENIEKKDKLTNNPDNFLTKKFYDVNNTTLSRSFPDSNEPFHNQQDFSHLQESKKSESYILHDDQLNGTSKSSNKTLDTESAVKTFALGDEIPFLNSFFNRFTTKTEPSRPIIKPQVTMYEQQNQPTTKLNRYTYLINIVPKTTTPTYDLHKETIKITIQGQNPTFNKRPVYNNNKLEYRPVNDERPNHNAQSSYNTHNSYSRPEQNRPQTSFDQEIDKYDFNQNYNRPKPTLFRPSRPSNDDTTSEYNPYGLVTFSYIETTTKRQDLFNRPELDFNSYDNQNQQISNTYYQPTRPTIVAADSSYGINMRPVRPQNIRPVSTGITIFIDNKIRPKPLQDNQNLNTGYQSSSEEEDSENVPLFTRPNYHRPLLQKPEPDYRPPNPKPQFDNHNNDHYNLQSDYGHFSTWTDRPNADISNDAVDNDFDSPYISQHKQRPNSSNKKPTRPTQNPKPTNVNINLASEYGNQAHNDISIVIDPNLRYKSQIRPTQSSSRIQHVTTRKPSKYYYVGNILHKYPEPGDTDKAFLSKSTKTPENIEERHQIIKENYNNAWTPDKIEHKLFYSTYDDSEEIGPYEGIKGNMKESDAISTESLLNITSELKTIMKHELDDSRNKSVVNLNSSPSGRRESFVKAPVKKSSNSKTNDQVFFDIIPSENSPSRWAYYYEKPEENPQHHGMHAMPSIDSDPLASKEVPHPITFASRFKASQQRHKMKT